MPRVVHFEIHGTDPQQLSTFYRKVFDWSISKWDGPQDYWLIKTGEPGQPGIDGGLFKRMPGQSGNRVTAYVCTIDVPNLAEYANRITANGGNEAVPKMAIPGVGWLAYYTDPDGNIFGIMQRDAAAK